MTTSLRFASMMVLLLACDGSTDVDAGLASDGGARLDAGGEPEDAATGLPDAGDDPVDAGGDPEDAGMHDAGGTPADAGSGDGCPCFGAAEIAAIEAHAEAGGDRGCEIDSGGGTFISSALSSTEGAQNLQVTVQEIHGFAGTDWTCGYGCSDLNDDAIDDCAGAALGAYAMEIVTEGQHDACRALIVAACE